MIAIQELQRRLPPDTKIKARGAFSHLNAHCCDPTAMLAIIIILDRSASPTPDDCLTLTP
jgi:hypothetical protein